MKATVPLDYNDLVIANTMDCPHDTSGGLKADVVVAQDKQDIEEKPGAVCSDCGRTVTKAEYSRGESKCCKAPIVAEEEYGR